MLSKLTVHVDGSGGVREMERDVFAWNIFLGVNFKSGESLERQGGVGAGARLKRIIRVVGEIREGHMLTVMNGVARDNTCEPERGVSNGLGDPSSPRKVETSA